ncbi:HlyC/CorC family transporter [Amaricoccus tamworthensis]|uniref:HlyC/CorC family transporter n=1 Tax=Amaricoccus tamworthensis TaxID=57002 RepID=UPI003C7DA23D
METAEAATSFWPIVITGIAILVLLCLSAVFSGSETALTTAKRGKLHSMDGKGDRGAGVALKLIEDKERLIGAILLGNNLVNILATSLATMFFTVLLGEGAVAIATLVMTGLVLVFSEVLPKTYAITNAETMAARVSPLIRGVVVVLSPVVNAVRALVRTILGVFGVSTDPEAHFLAAQEEIAGAIALHHSEGAVEKDDRDRLLGALDLGQRRVEEVMLHRREIEMIDADLPPAEILAKALESQHTRIPLYREDPENIIGVLHAKDLSRAVHQLGLDSRESPADFSELNIEEVAMEPYFVPETTPLDEQMRAFLLRRSHFALVVDEYGALHGLITLEDIIEEIVGDITDEHDTQKSSGIEPNDDGSVEVDGGVTIRDLNRDCDWSLPDEEANTIAGLVIHEAQAIPNAGQVFSFHGFRFEVLERENNRLTRIRVRKLL